MAPTPYIDPYEVDRALRARPDGRTADDLDREVLGQWVEQYVPPCKPQCWGDQHVLTCEYAAQQRGADWFE